MVSLGFSLWLFQIFFRRIVSPRHFGVKFPVDYLGPPNLRQHHSNSCIETFVLRCRDDWCRPVGSGVETSPAYSGAPYQRPPCVSPATKQVLSYQPVFRQKVRGYGRLGRSGGLYKHRIIPRTVARSLLLWYGNGWRLLRREIINIIYRYIRDDDTLFLQTGWRLVREISECVVILQSLNFAVIEPLLNSPSIIFCRSYFFWNCKKTRHIGVVMFQNSRVMTSAQPL